MSQAGPSVLFLYAIIFLIFYFVFIKPQSEEKKKRKLMIANLKKNDSVVTAGGIHGVVSNVKDNTVVLRLDDNVKVEFDKESISTLIEKQKN